MSISKRMNMTASPDLGRGRRFYVGFRRAKAGGGSAPESVQAEGISRLKSN